VPGGQFTNHAEKLSGRLLSELSFSTIEDIWGKGLHTAMDELQIQLNDIGGAILGTYIHPATPTIVAPSAQMAAVPQ
jgi:uncharacterized alpha-E superfamily protein